MTIIGLTGGIGSGKSTVLKMFESLGATVFIADVEAKKLMNNDKNLVNQIKQLIGNEAYKNGALNRKYIADIVFNDKEKLKALNNIVHPAVQQHFKNFIKSVKMNFVVYEAAILFESGGHQLCDYLVLVRADLEERIQRVIKRDGLTRTEVEARINNQENEDAKIQKSHFVIHNDNLTATKLQVKTIFELLLKSKNN